jgi:DNA-binding transcriptional ArsR family regulator
VLSMEFIAEIRRRHFVSGESISSIARSLKLSRPTIRKALKAEVEPVYQRQHQPTPKLGALRLRFTGGKERISSFALVSQFEVLHDVTLAPDKSLVRYDHFWCMT